jgi:transposase InsO family protein
MFGAKRLASRGAPPGRIRRLFHRCEPGAHVELIHHSDRDSQYTSIDYTQTLAEHRPAPRPLEA